RIHVGAPTFSFRRATRICRCGASAPPECTTEVVHLHKKADPSTPWPTFAQRERKKKSAIPVGMTWMRGRRLQTHEHRPFAAQGKQECLCRRGNWRAFGRCAKLWIADAKSATANAWNFGLCATRSREPRQARKGATVPGKPSVPRRSRSSSVWEDSFQLSVFSCQ